MYPLVPGHEVVGTITAIGERVNGLALGQWVGVGWQRGACNQCDCCQQGLQNLCAGSRLTVLAGYGALLIVCESIIDLLCPSRTF